MKLICSAIGANWKQELAGFTADQRIGDSHLNVPGPDGKLGFGGSCFPKDINAFMSMADELGVDIVDAVGTSKTFSVYAGVSTSGGLVGPLQMEFICSILENSTAS